MINNFTELVSKRMEREEQEDEESKLHYDKFRHHLFGIK
jgi:hypothetical protein